MYRRSPCHNGRIYFDFSEEVVKRLHASTFRSGYVHSRTLLWVILSVLRPPTLICMFISHFRTLSLFLCAPDWFACLSVMLATCCSLGVKASQLKLGQLMPKWSKKARFPTVHLRFICVNPFLLFLSLFRLRSWIKFCANTQTKPAHDLQNWLVECGNADVVWFIPVLSTSRFSFTSKTKPGFINRTERCTTPALSDFYCIVSCVPQIIQYDSLYSK